VLVRATYWVLASISLYGGASAADEATNEAERGVNRFVHVEISPNGRLIASVEGDTFSGAFSPARRDLIIRKASGSGDPIKVALPCGQVPQCWPESPAWAPDSGHLTFALRAPGGHAYALYTIAGDGSHLEKIFDFNGTLTGIHYVSEQRIAVLATENAVKEVGATEAGAAIVGDLEEVPEQRIAVVEGRTLRWVSPPDLFVYEYAWTPGGNRFVGTAAPGDGDANWWTAKLYEFTSGHASGRVLYAPANVSQQIAMPAISRDGTTLAFIAGLMSDQVSTGGDVFTMPLDGGPAANLTPSMHSTAQSINWGCDGHLIVRLLAFDKTQYVDLGDGKRAKEPRVLWNTPESVPFFAGGTWLACPSGSAAMEHESFNSPPEIQVGTMGHWHDLTSTNAGSTKTYTVKNLSWKSDGFDIQGWLLLPAQSSAKRPMVTLVHGGPASSIDPYYFGAGVVAELLSRGYAVLYPNPRGSFGQGEAFTLANVRDWGYGDFRDIMTGIDTAIRLESIDPGRLGITGRSYGGYMTMWAVTQTHRFKAAVAGAGVSNWMSYYGQSGIAACVPPYLIKSPYEDPAAYLRSSPISFITNVKTPTLEFVGERDIETPVPQTLEFWHALRELNVPTSIMIYPGDGHQLQDPDHVRDAVKRTVAWFDRYLTPKN
jgi:dipeptidyl aminopeptidase/acylaminoacyl peptidase